MKKRAEEAAVALSRKTLAVSILKTILYWAAVVVVWVLYAGTWKRPLTHPTAIIFTLLLVIPFVWPKVHKRWTEKSWHGTVAHMKDIEEMKQSGNGRAVKVLTHLEITFRTPEGNEKVVFREGQEYKVANAYYHMNDEVWKLKCLKYPINLTDEAERTEDIFCPKCGKFTNAAKKQCHWCKAALLK